MDNSKVYGILEGSKYEGNNIGHNVYTDREFAKSVAKEIVSDMQTQDRDACGDAIGEECCPVHEWKEETDGYWTNGIDEVKVWEFIVDDTPKGT